MLDEVPPAIPLRTVNRLELVAEDPESMPLGQYDVVMGEQIQESSYDVVQDPNAASSVYEEPTPCKCMGLETYASTLCMAMYSIIPLEASEWTIGLELGERLGGWVHFCTSLMDNTLVILVVGHSPYISIHPGQHNQYYCKGSITGVFV